MRGYFSSDGGNSGDRSTSLAAPLNGTNDTRFDLILAAFDTRGNVFYSYIVCSLAGKWREWLGDGSGQIQRRRQNYPNAAYFSFESGSNHFNDKPMITTDTNLSSPFRDNIYVAGMLPREALSAAVALWPFGRCGRYVYRQPGGRPQRARESHCAVPFVGPNGEVYLAWNDTQPTLSPSTVRLTEV